MGKDEKKKMIGEDRRMDDRRHKDLGGPVLEDVKLLYTREEAIEQILEWELEYMRDMDDADLADIVLDGWRSTPLNKLSHVRLEEQLQKAFENDQIKVRG